MMTSFILAHFSHKRLHKIASYNHFGVRGKPYKLPNLFLKTGKVLPLRKLSCQVFEITRDKPAVKVDELSKSFKIEKSRDSKQPSRVDSVKQVSFVARQGEVFGLLGPNASGKTTLLRCLATLIAPDSGTFEIFGVNGIKHPD
ncbi:ABC transporter, ATP-binding protein, partial [Galdieria sulphuraria]